VVGRGVTDAQRGSAQLLEGICATLRRRPRLVGRIRSPERREGDASLLSGGAVEQAREGEPAVLGRRGAQRTVAMLARLVRGERLGPDAAEDAARGSTERRRVEALGEFQQLLFDCITPLEGRFSQHLGDQLCVARSDSPVGHGLAGRLVVPRCPACGDLLLGFRVTDLLLFREAAPAIEQCRARRGLARVRGSTGHRCSCSPRPHRLELQQWTAKAQEQSLELIVAEVVDNDGGESLDGFFSRPQRRFQRAIGGPIAAPRSHDVGPDLPPGRVPIVVERTFESS